MRAANNLLVGNGRGGALLFREWHQSDDVVNQW